MVVDLNEHLIKSGVGNDLRKLMLLLSEKCIEISRSFSGKQHLIGSKNIFGEEQVALDKHANNILVKALKQEKLASKVVSEEEERVVDIPGGKNFSVILDPIDGCSSIDVNLTVGTIIGILEGKDLLQKGEEMAAAIAVLYGPLTILSYSVGKGVHEFVLNGKFVLKEENVKMPKQGNILSSGGLRRDFLPNHLKFIETLEKEGYKIRYTGAYVSDMYQIMHKGGLYCYPKLKGMEKGKLRFLFEVNPMGFLVKQAGGMISDGAVDLTKIKPQSTDERTPLYVGGEKEIKQANSILGG